MQGNSSGLIMVLCDMQNNIKHVAVLGTNYDGLNSIMDIKDQELMV